MPDPVKVLKTWEFIKGVGRGIATGAKGTWNFATEGAWKAETWKGAGNLALGMAMTQANPIGGAAATASFDAKFGTNTSGAVNALNASVAGGIDKFVNGDAGQKGEVVGQVAYGIVEGVVLEKGVGLVADAIKGGRAVSTAGEASNTVKTNTLSPHELETTHGVTLSKKEFKALRIDIQQNRVKTAIDYVESNGKKFVVNGNNRTMAARQLGITSVPVNKVNLPYGGYRNLNDLVYTRY